MMTSPKLEEAGSQEPASKRQRLSPEISSSTMAPSLKSSEGAVDNMVIYTTNADVTNATSQGDKEASVGILRFVNEKDPGFSGILKQRYAKDNCLRLTHDKLGQIHEGSFDSCLFLFELPSEVSVARTINSPRVHFSLGYEDMNFSLVSISV